MASKAPYPCQRFSSQRGQSNSEYIAIVIAVGIALVAALKFTDMSVKCKFDLAFRQIFVGYQVPEKCLELIVARNDEAPEGPDFEPLPFDELFQPPVPPSPPPPPVPPQPIPPGTDPVRHHVGDGNCSANLCGGGLANEGVRYDKVFSIDTEAVAAAGIDAIKISFLVNGVDTQINTLSLNGQVLGNIVNGYNEFTVSTASLLGTNTLSIISVLGPWAGGFDHDDFEFWDISVTWVE